MPGGGLRSSLVVVVLHGCLQDAQRPASAVGIPLPDQEIHRAISRSNRPPTTSTAVSTGTNP
ncbi:MAG: hypothetical protein IPM95_14410 [Sphingobacteriales bacterium]|nr:hypothetical protein [Sphingobacteriales bacterium]